MNTLERETLERFLQQLASARLSHKDSDAESLIRQACDRQPDAAYLLVQRALLLEQALQQAEARIASQQAELDRQRPSSGFLGNNAWGNAPSNPPAGALPGSASPAARPWGSGILGNIATTAAGVVAGSFLFQGIEHLLGADRSTSHAAGFTPLDTPAGNLAAADTSQFIPLPTEGDFSDDQDDTSAWI
ncbi:MAG: hypothetical protein RIR00_1972 [Pseudomonadota bacterium]|jgi:hypothetical protein